MRYIPHGSQGRASDNVIVMNRFRRGPGLSPLRQAEAYWLALCDEGGLPRRTRIDPRALANILDYTFILERVTPRVARFRLAGTHLEELAGMDVRGLPFTALFADGARSEAGTILDRVFSAPNVAELRLEHPVAPGRPAGEGRMILLPLTTDDGEVARALGVIVADPGTGPLPCRFNILDRLLRPAPAAAAAVAAKAPQHTAEQRSVAAEEFAESPAEFAGACAHLRLVK